MDYFGIIKKAFHITIKHKFLWIFGILAGGAAGFRGYSFNMPSSFDSNPDWSKYTTPTENFDWVTFWANYGGLILALMAIVMIVAIVFFIFNIVSQGALVASVEKIEAGEKSDFYHGFHAGWHQFWRIWAMSLTYLLMILLSLIVLMTPICVLVISGQYIIAFILGLLLFLICLLFWILIGIISPYSLRVIVLKKNGIFESIRESLHIVRDNFLDVIVIYLILIGISVLVGIAVILAILLLVGLLSVIGYGIFLANATIAVIYGCIVGLALLVAMTIFSGAYNSFYSSVITLTYLKIIEK